MVFIVTADSLFGAPYGAQEHLDIDQTAVGIAVGEVLFLVMAQLFCSWFPASEIASTALRREEMMSPAVRE